MFKYHRKRLWAVSSVAVLVVILADIRPTNAALTSDQVATLEQLDSDQINKILELTKQIDAWKKTIQEVKSLMQNADAAGAAGESDDASPVEKVLTIARTLQQHKEILKQFVALGDKLETQLRGVESAGADVAVDEEADLTLDQLRSAARMFAEADAAGEILEELVRILELLQKLREPAEFARTFADTEITVWLAKPREAAGITFKILKTDPTKSLFSKQADIVIEMQYGSGIVVEAHGLYFKYVETAPYFAAVLDEEKMQVTTNFKSLAKAQLTKAANEVLAKIDGPVTVSDFEFTDFGASKAGVKCAIAINMGELLPLSAKGSAILTTDQKLEWTGELAMSYKFEPPVPIGSTPLGIHLVKGHWAPDAKKSSDPKARQVSVGTLISTVVSETDKVVALDVSLAFDFPIRAVDLDGRVTFNSIAIGDIWGTIDLDQELAEANFKIPGRGSVIPTTIFNMEGRTTITRAGLESVGKCELFKMKLDESRLFLSSNGHGTLTSQGGFNLFGADFSNNLEAELGAELSYLHVHSIGSVSVDGIQPYGTLSCTVEIDGDSRRKDALIRVDVKTFRRDLDVSFTVRDFNECTLALLRKELNAKAVQAYHQFLKDLANADQEGRKLAAGIDHKTRQYLDTRLGGPWKSGNPELDRLGGELSSVYQNTGGQVSDAVKQGGGAVSDAWKDTMKQGEKISNAKWPPKL